MKLFKFKKTLVALLLLVFCVFALSSAQPGSCAEDSAGQWATYVAVGAAEAAVAVTFWPLSTVPMICLSAADIANDIAFWTDWGLYSDEDDN